MNTFKSGLSPRNITAVITPVTGSNNIIGKIEPGLGNHGLAKVFKQSNKRPTIISEKLREGVDDKGSMKVSNL